MSSPLERARDARLGARRLGAVHATGLLDTPPSEALDRLTRLASTLIDAPATFISLVDADRDFYVSHCGFGEPLATSRELRGTTFCHYAMVNEGALVIDDTRADPLYREVPTVQSLGVAAYLGVPMKATDGEVIGSFCAIDFKPRAWTVRDVAVMEELAASAMREMKLLEAIGTQVRRADDAQAAALLAEAASSARRDVLNAVAHDLRDPLHTILLALGPLEAQASPQADPRLAASIALIRRQATRMNRLLDNLLDVARMEGGNLKLEQEPLDAAGLMAEVAEDFALQANAADVTFELDLPRNLPAVPGDRARLTQAVANLVSNALKFTPRGGRTRLSATHAGDVMRLQVSDSGCGIDAAALEKVFEPFWQANSQRTGVGLGLHIVRGIVERHGGAVRASSVAGAGATFLIELPLAPRAE